MPSCVQIDQCGFLQNNTISMNINLYSMDAGTEPSPLSASAAGMAFDANLIARLEGDHAGLIAIFSRLQSMAAAQPHMVVADLILLRELFQDHLMMEETHFYAYLDRLLADHASVRDEARAVWRDMEEIAVSVAQFIHNWISTPPADNTVPVFLEQLRATMKVLLARIELEERTLYTLYTRTL
jgi:hypothetical protein